MVIGVSVSVGKVRPGQKMSEVIDEYKRKLEAGILPPDPARMIEFLMRTGPTIEHMLPVPPLIEKVHSEVVKPLIEALPRLPMTSEPPAIKWKEWIKEEW
ncbi:MAG: hypothetical protein QXU64_02020 [Thermofilaceae archaeon]